MRLSLGLSLAGGARDIDANKVPFLIILGQSNARGSAPNADIGAGLSGPFSLCRIWNGTDFVSLDLSTNRAVSGEHGFEMALGKAFQDAGQECYIFKDALGGSVLDNDVENSNTKGWLPFVGNRNSRVFNTGFPLANAVSAAQATGRVFVPVFVWCQGEADSNDTDNPGAYLFYERNLTELVGQVRAFLGVTAKTVVVRTSNSITAPAYSRLSEVRAAQDNVVGVADGAVIVSGDGLALQADNLHYTSGSYATLGGLIYTEVTSATVNGLGTSVWDGRTIHDPRVTGVAGAVGVTVRQGTSAANVAGTLLPVAVEMTGKQSMGGRSIHLSTIDALTSVTGCEMAVELATGAGYPSGGPLICASDLGSGVFGGYHVRLQNGEAKLFRLNASSATLLSTYNDSDISAGGDILPIRLYRSGDDVNVDIFIGGTGWVSAISVDDTTYTSAGAVGMVAGWSSSALDQVLIGPTTSYEI